MDCGELLASLERDSMARLRHLVLERAGICPLSFRARLISDRQIIAYACFMALDRSGDVPEESGSFSRERFERMKEAAG